MSFIFNYIKNLLGYPPEPQVEIAQSVPKQTSHQNQEIGSRNQQDYSFHNYNINERTKTENDRKQEIYKDRNKHSQNTITPSFYDKSFPPLPKMDPYEFMPTKKNSPNQQNKNIYPSNQRKIININEKSHLFKHCHDEHQEDGNAKKYYRNQISSEEDHDDSKEGENDYVDDERIESDEDYDENDDYYREYNHISSLSPSRNILITSKTIMISTTLT